jgi:hypothetical protein
MLRRVAAVFVCLAALALVVVALLAACDGDEQQTETLSEARFKSQVVTAIASQTELGAEPAFGPAVRVTESDTPNWLRLSFADAYAKYRRNPADEDAIVASVVSEAETRMNRGIGDAAFEDVRGQILPLVKPRTQLQRLPAGTASADGPDGIAVVFGVQTGNDQFTLIGSEDARRWRREPVELLPLALDNLERQTNRDEPLLCEPATQGQLCGWASGDAYDAARMLVPGLRHQIVRKIGPSVYAVPREDVFVALPREFADRIRQKVLRDFTAAENPVSPELFVERRGRLVVLGT